MMSGRSALRLGAAAVALTAAPVLAQERLTVDASVSAGIATNPFLGAGDTPTTGSATLRLTPIYVLSSPLTTFQFSGDVSVTKYFREYPTNDSYSLNASGTHQVSERTQISAGVGYVNSIVGAFNDLGVIGSRIIVPGVTPTLPTGIAPDLTAPVSAGLLPSTGLLLPDLITDPSLGGLGQRRQSYQASAGLQQLIGERDRLSLDFSAVAARSGGQFDEYNYVSQRAGYSRVLDQGLDVSANLQVGRTDYLRRSVGDATIISPSIGVNYSIAPQTRLSANVGAAIVRTDELTGTSTDTSINASATLCRQDTRWNACLSASRLTLPSAVQGVRTQNAVSATAGYRANTRESVSLAVSYSHAEAPTVDTLPNALSSSTEYLSARGDYSRTFSLRLSGFVSGGVMRAYDDNQSRGANIEGRVGLRYRFGAIQ